VGKGDGREMSKGMGKGDGREVGKGDGNHGREVGKGIGKFHFLTQSSDYEVKIIQLRDSKCYSLVPRPFPPPVFDHLQYTNFVYKFCILQVIKYWRWEVGTAWEQG